MGPSVPIIENLEQLMGKHPAPVSCGIVRRRSWTAGVRVRSTLGKEAVLRLRGAPPPRHVHAASRSAVSVASWPRESTKYWPLLPAPVPTSPDLEFLLGGGKLKTEYDLL